MALPDNRSDRELQKFEQYDGKTSVKINQLNGLVSEKYDFVGLTYTGDDLTTVVYKTGGSGGTTVATLTLTYTANVLDDVTKT